MVKPQSNYSGMDVGMLEIPADLSARLRSASGRQQRSGVTEVAPPQVKAEHHLSLPLDIDSYPFSRYANTVLKDGWCQSPGQSLHRPLTYLDPADARTALEIYKLILRFCEDSELSGWQEQILGNYIVEKGQNRPSLRDEILAQLVYHTWDQQADSSSSQRGWLLLTSCLSAFTPSPSLDKPLLKYVSDQGPGEYRSVCQHKLLTSLQLHPHASRLHPPTRLEWTANQRKGKMVVDVNTLNEEKFTAEVESWTTGEQLGSWLLSYRGVPELARGWSVSLLTDDGWTDLTGCDYVMDLLAGAENDDTLGQGPAQPGYLFSEMGDRMMSGDLDDIIPPAPNMQAPSLPSFNSSAYSSSQVPQMDAYVDDLFDPLLDQGSSVSDFDHMAMLNRRMRGGGGMQPSMYNGAGVPMMMPNYPMGMPMNPPMPAYAAQPMMPNMMPQNAAMPMMQPMPSMMNPGAMPQNAMPTNSPAVNPQQLAQQQQAFINQQALLMAQQMTLQAMTLSQQQQQEQLQKQLQQQKQPEREQPKQQQKQQQQQQQQQQQKPQPPKAPAAPAVPTPKSVPPVQPNIPETEDDDSSDIPESFQEKRSFFQKIGTPEAHPKPAPKVAKPLIYSSPPITKPPPPPAKSPPPPAKSPPPPAKSPPPAKKPPPVKTAPPPVKTKDPPKREDSSDSEPETSKASPVKQEPSSSIRELIKIFQSRPPPEPIPFEPVRVPAKQFVKKSDPKEEALAILRAKGPVNHQKKQWAPPPQPKKQQSHPPPPPPPALEPERRPRSISNSMREKQRSLADLFGSQRSRNSATPEPSSPILSDIPEPPSMPAPGLGQHRSMASEESVRSRLHKFSASVYFSSSVKPGKIFLRKELFYPREKFSHPYTLNLLCEQIMRDTYSDACVRISREERRKMKDLLANFHIGTSISNVQDDTMKKRVVMAARDNWANYFSRLFPVIGGNGGDTQILGVSHRDIKLLKMVGASGINPKHLKLLRSYSYAELLSVELHGTGTVVISLKSDELQIHSSKAHQITEVLQLFLSELSKDSEYVVCLKSYVTDDKSLLSLQKGDVIKVLHMDGLQDGWKFGSSGGRTGLFLADITQPSAPPDYHSNHMSRKLERKKSTRASGIAPVASRRPTDHPNLSMDSYSERSLEAGSIQSSELDRQHYQMTEFARKYFREAILRPNERGHPNGVRDLVQYTSEPINESLILYSENELGVLGAQCFMHVMQFMTDQPLKKDQTEGTCLTFIIQLGKEREFLRDEIFCQIIKQTTNNPRKESCKRGWLLLNLVAGFFPCSPTLLPYVKQHLQSCYQDHSHPYQEMSRTCEDSLRHSLTYGGRRHIPSHVEMEAILAGRSARRLPILLPGGVEFPCRVRSFSVAKEVVSDICTEMGVANPAEMNEFSVVATRSNDGEVRPIHSSEYLFDFLLDDGSIVISFHRLIWRHPLHFDNELFIEFHYQLVLAEYLSGKLRLPGNISSVHQQVAELAALQHVALGFKDQPSMQEMMAYLPHLYGVKPNDQNLLGETKKHLSVMASLSPAEAKAQFLKIASSLHLFGSNIFQVQKVSHRGCPSPCLVAVNHESIAIVHLQTQMTALTIPIEEVQSLRLTHQKKEKGQGVEINFGNSAQKNNIIIHLKKARELCHIIAIITETVVMPSVNGERGPRH